MVAKDGRQIAAEVGPELDFLSRVSRKLGVVDLVHDFFDPLVGDWNDLREESERWRKAAKVTEAVTKHVAGPLNGVEAVWQGKDAEAFLDHMRKVGLAGGDMSDAMNAMADALEETADGVRGIVQDMAHVLADAADSVSGTAALPLEGDQRAIKHIEELKDPVRELFESARQVLEAFLKLCDGVSGDDAGTFGAVKMDHRYPEQNWTYTPPAKSEAKLPEPAKASDTAAAGKGGGGAPPGWWRWAESVVEGSVRSVLPPPLPQPRSRCSSEAPPASLSPFRPRRRVVPRRRPPRPVVAVLEARPAVGR